MKERNIKICHIVSRVTGRDDGIFKHLLAQFTLLDVNIFNHTLICPYSKEIEKELSNKSIKIFFIPEIDTKSYLKTTIKIKRILKNNDFDIVCCHTLKPLIFGGYLNLFNNRKIVFFSHGILLDNDYNSKIEKAVYKILLKLLLMIKKVIFLFPSEWNQNKLIAELGVKIETKVYYDGAAGLYLSLNKSLDENIERKIRNVGTKFKIVFAGRLAREKDPHLAIQIFQNLSYDGVSLHIFGDGELKNDLEKYISEHNINNVYFYGYVENVNRYFKFFDLLILTSKREGMPMVIWEAMDSGLPFVAKNVGGINEILKHGQCGLIFETKEEAVEKIKSLLSKPDLLIEMSKNGKKVLTEKFNVENFIKYFTNIYLNI